MVSNSPVYTDSTNNCRLFIAQGPMCLLAFIAVYFILELPKIEDSKWVEKLRRVDFLGAFFLILATSSLLIGLDRGSNLGWKNTVTIVCMSLSAPLYAVFIWIEKNVAANPFAPGRVIFDRSLFAAYLCNFFAFGGYLGMIFYLPLFFQAVSGLTSTQAGVRLIPGIIASVCGSVGGGLIMQKTGKYYWLTVMAYTSLLIGQIIVVLCSGLIITSTPGIVTGLIFTGLGGGTGVTTTLIALIANANPADQAIVTACSYLFRSLGSVIGVSLSATVVQQSLRVQLRARLEDGEEADKIVERVRQSLDYIRELEPHTREIVKACYQRATTGAFALAIVIVSGALVSAFFIREKRLSR